MLYLARNNSVRIFVHKAVGGWQAKLMNDKFYFEKPKRYVEDVIYQLIEDFGPLTLSTCVVDYKGKHISQQMGKYCVLDNSGKNVYIPELKSYYSDYRLLFTGNGEIKQLEPIIGPCGPLPDFLQDAKPLFDDSELWCAKDIDTGLWVCFNSKQPKHILSQNAERYNAIADAIDAFRN